MSDSLIQVPPDSTGKKIDTEQVTVGAANVQRQRVQLAGAAAAAIAVIKNAAPDAADYALAVRVIGTLAVNLGLTDTQLRATPVPISGTVTASGPLTDTQLRAANVKTAPQPRSTSFLRGEGNYTEPVEIIPAPASGKKICIDQLSISHDDLLTCDYQFRDADDEGVFSVMVDTRTTRFIHFVEPLKFPIDSNVTLAGDTDPDVTQWHVWWHEE